MADWLRDVRAYISGIIFGGAVLLLFLGIHILNKEGIGADERMQGLLSFLIGMGVSIFILLNIYRVDRQMNPPAWEKGKSLLYFLKPIIDRLPVIEKPEGHVHFKMKMFWTFFILVIYFVMTNVFIFGLDSSEGGTIDVFENFRAILAGASGSLMHLGIGPIVTGSIIMQLFTGAKIINLDVKTNEEDKEIYQGAQKVIVLIMILVESIPQVYGFLSPDLGLVAKTSAIGIPLIQGNGDFWIPALIILQLFLGSYMVFFMDELVSKWGIGSGISLFIAAGVCEQIVTGTLNWLPADTTAPLTMGSDTVQPNLPGGTIFKVLFVLGNVPAADLTRGSFEVMFLQQPNPVLALITTIIIFIIVAYAESTRIELPLSHGRVRGARGRYPIRLIYASNIPVILIAALLANINLFSLMFYTHPAMSQWPLIGGQWWIGAFPAGETRPIMGGAWYLSQISGVGDWLLPLMNFDKYGASVGGHSWFQVFMHLVVYITIYILGSIMFAKFWISTTGMGPEEVAKQIQNTGMQIPGFRRDPAIVQTILDRYIPVVTVISGAFVGALAAFADMLGTTGQSSGTGVLLTVGILIRLYEEIGKEQAMEMHPILRGILGKEA